MGFRFQRQNNNSNQQVLTEEEQIANLLNDLDNYRSNNNYTTKLDRVLKVINRVVGDRLKTGTLGFRFWPVYDPRFSVSVFD